MMVAAAAAVAVAAVKMTKMTKRLMLMWKAKLAAMRHNRSPVNTKTTERRRPRVRACAMRLLASTRSVVAE